MKDLFTYALKQGPPAPTFEEYAAAATESYRRMLESTPAEWEVQEFLESNPSFVPGGHSPGSHGPLHGALFSQPELFGLRARRPDFMWITSHSGEWYPTLIEIEQPDRRIFKRDGTPSSDFSHARNQLSQWRAWFSDPVNVQKFVQEYGVPPRFTRSRVMRLHLMLIYGRRSEFEDSPELTKLRAAQLTGIDEELVSFDRLRAQRDLSNAVTVRARTDGRCQVTKVAPTFKLGPAEAECLLHLDGLDNAIAREDRIPKDRRDFLLERLPYWKDWAATQSRGVINLGDEE